MRGLPVRGITSQARGPSVLRGRATSSSFPRWPKGRRSSPTRRWHRSFRSLPPEQRVGGPRRGRRIPGTRPGRRRHRRAAGAAPRPSGAAAARWVPAARQLIEQVTTPGGTTDSASALCSRAIVVSSRPAAASACRSHLEDRPMPEPASGGGQLACARPTGGAGRRAGVLPDPAVPGAGRSTLRIELTVLFASSGGVRPYDAGLWAVGLSSGTSICWTVTPPIPRSS